MQSEILRMRVPNHATNSSLHWRYRVAESSGRAATGDKDTRTNETCGPMRTLWTTAKECRGDTFGRSDSERRGAAGITEKRDPSGGEHGSNVAGQRARPAAEVSWWRRLFAWPTPAYAFAGIAAVAIVAWIGLRILHPPSAEQLLAKAYTRAPNSRGENTWRKICSVANSTRHAVGFRQATIFAEGGVL